MKYSDFFNKKKMKNILKKKSVVCSLDEPIPIAYLNIYEEGDIWVKTKGCENCKYENRKKCCGGCPMVSEKGCWWHLESPKSSSKPFYCVTLPIPSTCCSYCSLEFECIAGKNINKIRKVSKAGSVFD